MLEVGGQKVAVASSTAKSDIRSGKSQQKSFINNKQTNQLLFFC